MGTRDNKPDAAPRRPCGHPPPPRPPPRSAPGAQPLALPARLAPEPRCPRASPARRPGRPARPAPLPALRPPAASSSGAPAPGPPRSPSSFSSVCPVKTLPGSRVPTTANPPLVTSSPAASAAGARLLWQRSPRPGALAWGPGFPCWCCRLRRASGAREAREASGALAALASCLRSELAAALLGPGNRAALLEHRVTGEMSSEGLPQTWRDNYSLLLLLHTGCWRRVVTQPQGACSARWKSGLINVAKTGEWAAVRCRDWEV